MLRVQSGTSIGYTEFEEDILFDDDDPDFEHDQINNVLYKLPAAMSLASVHPVEIHSSHSSLATLSHSLDDIAAANWSLDQFPSETVITIEELRDQLNCCFTCGVSWADSHVSLDCTECGGYAMERPCMACDGSCGKMWKRDLSMSHASGKARWAGECGRIFQEKETSSPLPQNLSLRLEKLRVNSS